MTKMYDHLNSYRPFRYPAELSEAAEKIASGKPAITWDDILDFFLALEKEEKDIKKPIKRKRPEKKERRVVRR